MQSQAPALRQGPSAASAAPPHLSSRPVPCPLAAPSSLSPPLIALAPCSSSQRLAFGGGLTSSSLYCSPRWAFNGHVFKLVLSLPKTYQGNACFLRDLGRLSGAPSGSCSAWGWGTGVSRGSSHLDCEPWRLPPIQTPSHRGKLSQCPIHPSPTCTQRLFLKTY